MRMAWLLALCAAWLAGSLACSTACSTSGGDQVRDRESAAAPAKPPSPPPVFTIEYRSFTHFPTCRSNQRIKVDAQGELFRQVNDKDCPTTNGWSAPYAAPIAKLSDGQRAQLASLITDSGVLGLPPLTTDPNAPSSDGTRHELEIEISGRHVIVAVDHASVAAFTKVRQALIDLVAVAQ